MDPLLAGTMCDLTQRVRIKPREHFPPGILARALRTKLVESMKVFARTSL